MADNGTNRRQKAAQARATAVTAEQRRERTARIVGAIVVAVVAVGIIGIAVFARSNSSSTATADRTAPDPAAAVPAGVLPAGDEHEFAVPYGTGSADVPVLAIWEDFQCPGCGAVEQANGAGIASLAESGKVRLIWRPTTFLDRNLANNDSERAVAAWGCAIDAGKAREYHDLVYASQPEREGDGFTDEQLLALGEQAGISGDALATFQQCVADGTYRAWAANGTQTFDASGVPGTPYATLNGTELATEILVDPAQLEQAVAEATK